MQTQTGQRISRLKLGTNTLQALVVNDKPIVAATPDGLYIDPRYFAALSDTVVGETAYILGTVTLNGVDLVIDAHGISIAGIGTIAGEQLTELRLHIDDEARVHVEAY